MELIETNVCPNCGGKLEEKNGQYYCLYCGKNFREEDIAEKLAEVKKELGGVVADELIKQRMEDIANARRNLYAAIHEEYIDSNKVLQYSREVKKYLSDDVQASFYETAVSSNAKAINKFLDNIDAEKYDYLAPDIIEFMTKSLEKSNILSLKDFIDKVYRLTDNERFVDYTTRVESEAEKIDEGIYRADLPRDVFLAYSSADMNAVHEITEYIEDQGLTCFVAERNLRHGKGAVENYKTLLETAARNCKCLVFMSSEQSRNFGCDALKIELPYIKENLPKMGRVEYIVEEYKNTPSGVKNYLKDFFDGLEFCRDKDDLISRILNNSVKKTKTQDEKYCKSCGSKNPLNVKFCGECGNKEFVNTYEEYVKASAEKRVREEYEKELEKMKSMLNSKNDNIVMNDVRQLKCPACGSDEFIEHNGVFECVYCHNSIMAPSNNRIQYNENTHIIQDTMHATATDSDDFEIENGVLKKYKGKGGDVVIPDGVTSIGDSAFDVTLDYCNGITRIMPPNNVTGIIIPNGVTSIGKSAFSFCYNLTSITIPNSVTNIGQGAFSDCSSLTSLVIPNGITDIKPFTFWKCSNLTNIIIPNSVTNIGDRAFSDCSSLKSITIPNSVTSIGEDAFWDCSSLTSIVISNGVTDIRRGTFANCSSLTSIIIPNNVTKIGQSAFTCCHNLTSVTIPSSVTSIEYNVFRYCNKRLTIKCNAEEQPSGWHKDWNKKWNGILSGRYKVIWGYKG